MLPIRSSCCFAFVLLVLLTEVISGAEKTIPVRSYWQKIAENINTGSTPVNFHRRWSTGLDGVPSDQRTIIAKIPVGTDIKPGDSVTINSIEIKDSFNSANALLVIDEISSLKDQSATLELAPQTRVISWQYVVDIAGVAFYTEIVVLFENSDREPEKLIATAKVEVSQSVKSIGFGVTPLRIRHKATGRYLTLVIRKGWNAGTLGDSDKFTFVLENKAERGYRIKALTVDYPGYVYMYSSDTGGIYFDEDNDSGTYFNPKQYWYLESSGPLADGAVVKFRNARWPTEFMSYYPETSSSVDVYSIKGRNDDWILEVA